MPTARQSYSKHGCFHCKKRKLKCDESQPTCSYCNKRNLICKYPIPGERFHGFNFKKPKPTLSLPYEILELDLKSATNKIISGVHGRESLFLVEMGDGSGDGAKDGAKKADGGGDRGDIGVGGSGRTTAVDGDVNDGVSRGGNVGQIVGHTGVDTRRHQGDSRNGIKGDNTGSLISGSNNTESKEKNGNQSNGFMNENGVHNSQLNVENGVHSDLNAGNRVRNRVQSSELRRENGVQSGLFNPSIETSNRGANSAPGSRQSTPYFESSPQKSPFSTNMNSISSMNSDTHRVADTDASRFVPQQMIQKENGVTSNKSDVITHGNPSTPRNLILPAHNNHISPTRNSDHINHIISMETLPFEENLTYLQDEFNIFDQNDLDTLADDLQQFVKATMNNSADFPVEHHDIDVTGNYNNYAPPHKDDSVPNNQNSAKPVSKKPDVKIPKNLPLDYIKVENRQEKFYLEEFYNEFSVIMFPLCAYDPESNSFFNPARDVLIYYATDEPVLLSAILAQGAKTAYKKHQLQDDDEAYDKYLSRCLDLCDPTLKGQSSDTIVSNIEIVLLTVLLLTSANASNANQNWRPHLKGAKNLILRSNDAIIKANKGSKKVVHSNLMICCKFWFMAFELLAALTTKLGGTLELDEIDLLMTRGTDHEVEVMKAMGIITPEGYNLLGGYHNDAIIYYRDLMKYLEKKRQNQVIDYEDTLCKLELLNHFKSLLDIEYFCRKGIVVSFGLNEETISKKLLDRIKIGDTDHVLSWLDIFHQTYTLASMISILTKFMDVSCESSTVQSLNNRLIDHIRFLLKPSIAEVKNHSYLLRSSLFMLQWPMIVAASACFNEDDQFLLMKFFRLIVQLGSVSASMVLTRLYAVWEKKSKKSILQPQDDFDIVLY